MKMLAALLTAGFITALVVLVGSAAALGGCGGAAPLCEAALLFFIFSLGGTPLPWLLPLVLVLLTLFIRHFVRRRDERADD